MTEDLFATAWARFDWANELRQRMAEVWNEYLEMGPFTPDLEAQGGGVFIFRVWEEEPSPLELAVATGECLYNMRSALDYVI